MQVKQEISQQIANSSQDDNNSKGSPYSFVNKKRSKNNIHHVKESSEMSVRLFKDITHKVHSNNPKCEKRVRSKRPIDYENEHVGYAKIDLVHENVQDSDSDSIPLEHLNSKLSRIENAVHFFYERMNDNYTHCINEVGNLKDYIELKSERKAQSRMNSIYSNHTSALKTPIQGNKLRDFNVSSKKNTPMLTDGFVEIGQSTSALKRKNSYNHQFLRSRDITPEDKRHVLNQNQFRDYFAEEESDNFKSIGKIMSSKSRDQRQKMSRNNSGYHPSKSGLNRYNSMVTQSTTAINHHPARSFAIHL